MPKKIFILSIFFLLLSSIGFIDATYLTINHYEGVTPTCAIHGCEIVLTSHQNNIFGIPVALLGSLYYGTLLFLVTLALYNKNVSFIHLASRITPIGMLASIYFVYLQLFVIKAICQYCMLSAGTSTLLFAIGMYILHKTKKDNLHNM